MLAYQIKSSDLKNNIFIPKYYDPDLYDKINALSTTHDILRLGNLIDDGTITVQTGHEIGKMAYGTGNIPFVRTSDITNWEIKAIPKQGISEEIYSLYAEKEDVQDGDILLVRDGTYLIGTCCLVTKMDIPLVFQSHILKFRINDKRQIDPYLFFLVLNSQLVQRQIKNMQFTADIIDTLGNRYKEILLPVPKDSQKRNYFSHTLRDAINIRIKYKAAIKQLPILIEKVLDQGDTEAFDRFFSQSIDDILADLIQDTTTLEFGDFSAYTIKSSNIVDGIFLPKYYDPSIAATLKSLSSHCTLKTISSLVDDSTLCLATGDEIGKMAYGTGEIPFVRTSDFSNWEIKSDAKQGVSEEIYNQYAAREDIQAEDILLVRDGTYLVGTSCMITPCDVKMLYCGGIIKIRTSGSNNLDAYLLLGLLNSYIVKRQIRTKQFTRDVIDTLGRRFNDVILPIPNEQRVRGTISHYVKKIVENRIEARETISALAAQIC